MTMQFDLGTLKIQMDERGREKHELQFMGTKISTGSNTIKHLVDNLIVSCDDQSLQKLVASQLVLNTVIEEQYYD